MALENESNFYYKVVGLEGGHERLFKKTFIYCYV